MKITITDQLGCLTVIYDVVEISETRDGDFIVKTSYTQSHSLQPFHHPSSDVRKVEIETAHELKGRRRTS